MRLIPPETPRCGYCIPEPDRLPAGMLQQTRCLKKSFPVGFTGRTKMIVGLALKSASHGLPQAAAALVIV